MPDGARVAVWVIPNIEHFHADKPAIALVEFTARLVPDVLNYSWRDYGARVGIWRIMEIMQKHGVRATAALNAEVGAHYPEIIEAGNDAGWEWMAHGQTNSVLLSGMTEAEERSEILATLDAIERGTGALPRGWLSPALSETFNTPDVLAEAGIEYLADWVNDDQPYRMKVRRGSLVSIPYSVELNDAGAYLFLGRTPDEFYRMIVDQFDVLYAEGVTNARVMPICLHPFITGQPFRSKALDRALEYIAGHDGVWFATGSEIIDWYASV